MVYFQPADSGINSILGQMMFFKRFCDGYGIGFEYAVDLDRSTRNRVTDGIHALLFGDKLKNHRHMPMDESLGLHGFYQKVASGSFREEGRNILVYAGDYRNPREPGLWRLHEFQLHCLEQGFLSERFPYWAADLGEWTVHGSLLRDSLEAAPVSFFAHMRLGDSLALPSATISELLGKKAPGDVFSAGRFMTIEQFDLYRNGLLSDLPERHYAERGARMVDVSDFANALAGIRNRMERESRTVFASDGFTRAAESMSRLLDLPASAIEEKLNGWFEPVSCITDEMLLGESGEDLPRVLRSIARAESILSTSSLFPLTVKYALSGERALDGWTCIDASDALSRHLQYPSVIIQPLHLYEARLRKLAVSEPVPS